MKQRFSANWHMLERSFRKNYTMYIFLVLPIIFALSLNEVNGKVFKKITQSISIVPESLSAVVVVTMIKTLLSPSNGIINRVIEIFGGQAIFFLNSAEWFRPVYIMSHLWQQTVHITIPALFPTMSINSKLSAGLILNVAFEKILPMYTPISYKTADIFKHTSTVRPLAISAGRVNLFPVEFTTKTYMGIIETPESWRNYPNGIIYTGVGTFIGLFLTATCAYALAKKDLEDAATMAFQSGFKMDSQSARSVPESVQAASLMLVILPVSDFEDRMPVFQEYIAKTEIRLIIQSGDLVDCAV